MILLELLDGAAPARTFSLAADISFIGRSPRNEVALDFEQLAGRHALLVQGVAGATIEDLGSAGGTAVRRAEQRFDVGEAAGALELLDGDIIELGAGPAPCRLKASIPSERRQPYLVEVKKVGAEELALPDDPARLRRLYDAQTRVGRARDLDAVLEAMAVGVFEMVPHATHVTVVLQAEDAHPAAKGGRGPKPSGYLPVLTRVRPPEQAAAAKQEPTFVPTTRSVYRQVLQERTAVLAAEASQQLKATTSLMAASVRSTIAVPLWLGDEILGVLQVDNRDAPGMLKPNDLDLILLLAGPASLAVANTRLIKRLQVAEQRLLHENAFLKERERSRRGAGGETPIIGNCPNMQQLRSEIDKVAATNVTVLIEGETGTGKELVAAALHARSRRADKLFVAQNCAALTESLLESELFGHRKGAFTGATADKKGLFELADGSTLFLDEITEAPMAIQSKLLRALQEGEIRAVGASESKLVDVRVVAATNRNIEAEVQAGRFREDLYYRLKVFPVRVPPLRQRRADVALLVPHFLERYAREIGKAIAGVSTQALDLLCAYSWPGNVRELQNEIQRMVIQADPGAFVTPEHLSPQLRQGEQLASRAGVVKGSLKEKVATVEKYLVFEALSDSGGNKTAAAKVLCITREGLHKKLRQYGSQ